jgi:hypothetical protein
MAIASANYAMPVMVNGFLCKSCTDVDLAKAHIDPQHPSAGPFGTNAKADPTLAGKKFDGKTGAVTFGGSLAVLDTSGGSMVADSAQGAQRGGQLDLSI